MEENKIKTPFDEWFNVHDKEHLKALTVYMETGGWPKHFVPADVAFVTTEIRSPDTEVLYMYKKIAKAWIQMKTVPATRESGFPSPTEK